MTKKVIRIFDPDVDQDIVHFIESLDDHLDRVRMDFPENVSFLDEHFGSDTIATLAPLVAEKMRLTQSDGQEHSFAHRHRLIWYQVCTLPVEMDRARDWFVRVYGGYSKLLERSWNSPAFEASHCEVFYHIVYGWTERGGTWVHMAVIPVKRQSPITTILPIEFLTQEERRIAGV